MLIWAKIFVSEANNGNCSWYHQECHRSCPWYWGGKLIYFTFTDSYSSTFQISIDNFTFKLFYKWSVSLFIGGYHEIFSSFLQKLGTYYIYFIITSINFQSCHENNSIFTNILSLIWFAIFMPNRLFLQDSPQNHIRLGFRGQNWTPT